MTIGNNININIIYYHRCSYYSDYYYDHDYIQLKGKHNTIKDVKF